MKKQLLLLLLAINASACLAQQTIAVKAQHLSSVVPTIQNEFVIIVPSYNNKEYYTKNLDSIFNQTYPHYTVLYYDDVSTDNTADLVEQYVKQKNMAHKCTIIRNTQNIGGLGNIYHATHRSADHKIMVELDGDDWFSRKDVLELLNKIYQDPNVWLTYGQYEEYPAMRRGWIRPVPHDKAAHGLFRGHGSTGQLAHSWMGHLRTWRAWLFKRIHKEDLLDKRGDFFKLSWDHAMMWPMCEMACERVRFIEDVLYVYNKANPLSDSKLHQEQQFKTIEDLQDRPHYARLDAAPRKKALISGVTGQDGSYLAEFLLDKGYEVHGIKRRSATFNTKNIEHLYEDQHHNRRPFFLHYGDVTDNANIFALVNKIRPDEIYHLAAQSHVHVSFETPLYTARTDGEGTLNFLEAIHQLGLAGKTRFYQASTSELYGLVQSWPQNEKTPFYPRSPYAAAKLYAYWITVNYREAYNIFACNGILFNHESPRRGETFVTRKITRAAARIKHGLESALYLGNLDSIRDWGYAKDYVEAMWRMLQHHTPEDCVISSGEHHTVREFVELAFAHAGMNITWQGSGIDEVGIDSTTGNIVVRVDPRYFRPTEVERLFGDYSKAKSLLGWQPKTSFKELVDIMMDADLAKAQRDVMLRITTQP